MFCFVFKNKQTKKPSSIATIDKRLLVYFIYPAMNISDKDMQASMCLYFMIKFQSNSGRG